VLTNWTAAAPEAHRNRVRSVRERNEITDFFMAIFLLIHISIFIFQAWRET